MEEKAVNAEEKESITKKEEDSLSTSRKKYKNYLLAAKVSENYASKG